MPVRDIRVQDRGSFFDDSFFRESWEDFDRAMNRVLDRFDGRGNMVNKASRPECQDMYRRLRTSKIDDDMYSSQALTVTERDGDFQVVIDVRDFNPRDLQVKVVDDKVVLEGRFDKVSEDSKSSSSKAFYKEFLLPLDADIDKISTALSRDGILTIRAPKKEKTYSQNNRTNASKLIQETLNSRRSAIDRNDRQGSSQSSLNSDPLEAFSKDVKDRLLISDKDSGRSTCSNSPIPSGCTNLSSCGSPTPSDASSDACKSSTTDGYSANQNVSRQEQNFRARDLNNSDIESNASSNNVSCVPQNRTSTAVGSGGTASITVKNEDGKRTVTSEKSSLVQQKDGFLESKEIAAEVSGDDNQSARKEANTRMMKKEEDPLGRFSKSETANASDISESGVQRLPDGSLVTIKKTSTSTNNFKQFVSSSGGPEMSFFDNDFPNTFRSIPTGMGFSHPIMPQMSTNSMMSNMSNFSDMSNTSRMSGSSRFSNMSSNFSDFSRGFTNSSPFSSTHSAFSDFPNFGRTSSFDNESSFPQNQNSQVKKSFSSSSQSSSYSSNRNE